MQRYTSPNDKFEYSYPLNVRENLIFPNIREFFASRIQSSR